MHLAARFLHVGAAIVWVGYLVVLAWVILPAARASDAHAPNLGPLLERLSPARWLGPAVFLLGAWLVTASGHSWSQITQGAFGHGVLGGIVVAIAMMGLEHGLVFPRMRSAHEGPPDEREDALATATKAAVASALLGLLAALFMVYAGLGGL